jgi:hypothetical protein
VDTKKAADEQAELDKAYTNWNRTIDLLNPSLTELEKNLTGVRAKYDDLMIQAKQKNWTTDWIKAGLTRGEGFIRAADLEKNEKAFTETWGKSFLEFRDIQQEITDKELSEIGKRMSAEDLWARNITEKLGTRWTPELGARIEAARTRARTDIMAEQARAQAEAESRRTLAVLDVYEKQFAISPVQRQVAVIGENQRLITLWTESLARAKDESAKIQLADKIADANRQILEADYRLKELTGTMEQGNARGWQNYFREQIGTDYERGEREAKATADAWMKAFDDGFFNLFQGKWDSMLDIVDNFSKDMLRILSRRFAEGAMDIIFGGRGGGGSGLLGSILGYAGAFLGIGGGVGGAQAVPGIAGGVPVNANYVPSPYAEGGDFPAYRPMLVGERGPELIIPSSTGTVIPTGEFGNTLSITVPVSIGPEHKRLAGMIQENVEREVRRTIKGYAG